MNAVPAPLWRRLAAACYDALLLLAIWMVALLAALFLRQLLGLARSDHANALLLFLAGLGFFGWSWTHGGQTLGMRAWRLQVLRQDGAGLRWPVAAARYALMLTGWLALLALLLLPALPEAAAARVPHRPQLLEACAAISLAALLLPLLDGRRRGLHDLLTSTEVLLLPRESVRSEE
jgi:uncharacterized RDD family membrane protein YckC